MDELQETFDKYVAPSEEVVNGTVQRIIKGQLRTVIIDQDAYQAWQAERIAAGQAHREHLSRLDDLMRALNE